jgi:hypothetical protein
VAEYTEEGLERIWASLQNFSEGQAYARQEIEAALEVVMREFVGCACDDKLCVYTASTERLKGAIRVALNDPHGALAAHDDGVRDEHKDDLIDVLRRHPNVRVASNGSYVDDKHQEGGHG